MRSCGRNGWDYISWVIRSIHCLLFLEPGHSKQETELDLELGHIIEDKKDHLSSLSKDIWSYLIFNGFLTPKNIYVLRSTSRQIRGSINSALKFKSPTFLKKFQDEKLPFLQRQLALERKILVGGVCVSAFFGAGLQALAYDQAYQINQSAVELSVQNGWTYLVSPSNHSGSAICQILPPNICQNFPRELLRIHDNMNSYSERLLFQGYLPKQNGAILFGINLLTLGLAYFATHNFLHYSFKNSPAKKVFYGILAFSNHLLSLALPYLYLEKFAKTDALSDLCYRFSTLTTQYTSYLPNFWNLSFGGPWPIENPMEIMQRVIQQTNYFRNYSEIPISTLPAAAVITLSIITVNLWRAKLRDEIDRDLDEDLAPESTPQSNALHKKNL